MRFPPRGGNVRAGAVALVVLLACAGPAAAAGDLTGGVVVSSAAAVGKPAPIEWKLGYRSPEGSRERGSVGVGAGLPEGKRLECALWGGAGAVAGSIAGPLGAAVGGGLGLLAGLVVAHFFAPRTAAARHSPKAI